VTVKDEDDLGLPGSSWPGSPRQRSAARMRLDETGDRGSGGAGEG